MHLHMHYVKNAYIYTFISRIFNLPFSAVTFGFGPGVNMISLDVISGTFTSWSSFLTKLKTKTVH